jgi:uncharacterized protein
MKKIITRILIGLAVLILIFYAAAIVYIKTQETQLTFYEGYGQGSLKVPADSLHLKNQRFEIKSEDGVKLVGWILLSEKDSANAPWIIFCHGNASDISYPDYILRYKLFNKLGINVLTFDYRGFGESGGKPYEEGLYMDAMAVYKYLTVSKNVPPERIIFYGHSLGTGVAIEMATRVKAGALVIEAGYRSIPDVGQDMYPFLPMKLLVKNKFMNIDKVGKISIPKLFVHSSEDEIFAISEGKILYEKSLPPKSFLKIKGNHDAAPLISGEIFNKGFTEFLATTSARLILL